MSIEHCDCKNEYQDKVYGVGQRLHNESDKSASKHKRRCTVCKKEKTN